MSKKEIRENFDLEYLGRDKVDVESQTWHLKFTPKKTAVFKPAEFWVDGNGMPIQARVFEENNDSTTVLLSDFSKNIAINTSAFVLNLPRETKILSDRSSLRPSACFKPAPGDALKNWSDTVFSGRVTAAKGGDYTVKAERIWKGIVVREMVVKTMSPENKYAVRLMIGHQYIVFARNVIVEGKTISGLLPCSLTSDIFSDIGKKILKEIGIGKPLKKAFNKKKRRNFIENIRKRH